VALSIATNLVFIASAFAGDSAQLIGKDLGQSRDLVTSAMHGRNYVVEIDQQGKIKQVVDAGANGAGKEAQATVSSPVIAKSDSSISSIELPENYQGQAALDYISADLPTVAANHGLTPEKLQELFLADNTIRIDSNKRIFFIDDAAEKQADVAIAAGATTTVSTNTSVPIATSAALANTFKLHSKPGASKTIYLDFDGHTATGTAWSSSTIIAPAYDLSGNPAVFDNNEMSNIISIWNRVAEDYSPFDVDVTTESPTSDALLRTSTADSTYGTRVVITKTGTVSCTCGGIAYVGVVSMVNNNAYQPAWVFQQSLANNEKYIAEAISHEAGHNLGLFHDGQNTGTTVNAYYAGHGSGVTGWASIMGVGYYKNVTQWSSGLYPGATNLQDDFAVLASNGITPRTDAVGGTIATAGTLTNDESGAMANIKLFNVIETAADVDMYMVNTAGGLINLTVSPAVTGPNLDIKLSLYSADGNMLALSAPEAELSANINASVPTGTYYLAVSSSAHASTGADYGYPTYGSLGQYQITGSYVTAASGLPPIAELTASTLTGPASLAVNFSAANSVGYGTITGYQWSFGDGSTSTEVAPSHTYANVGTYTASLTVTNQYLLTSTKTVQITVTAPPAIPTVKVASLKTTVKKAKKMNASVSIKVVNAQGFPVANAVVTGVWSGAFSGRSSGNTDLNGMIVQKSRLIPLRKGGSATFTVSGINAAGAIYNPAHNAQTSSTVSW
jgi:hypothetical protein